MVLPLLLAAQIAVIAHRGEHLQHAENSIAAIQSAIQLGADYVELDVRTTRDGKLVLMHDKTVDRTTDGHGQVKDLSLDEIQHLRLRGYGDAVPTFEEALQAARGKMGIYVDWKEASPGAIYRALYAHGMLGNVVVYGDQGELHKLQQLAPDVHVMPEAGDSRYLKRSEKLLKPRVVAFDEDDFRPALIRQTLNMKADIYVDRLDKQDNGEAWQNAIDLGAKGIQTNHPAELLQFLRKAPSPLVADQNAIRISALCRVGTKVQSSGPSDLNSQKQRGCRGSESESNFRDIVAWLARAELVVFGSSHVGPVSFAGTFFSGRTSAVVWGEVETHGQFAPGLQRTIV